jgi:hypothetical protein
MRDPNRIKPFCDKLAEFWSQMPDIRFGQLMSNVLGEVYYNTKRDIFFIEDYKMMEEMQKVFNKENNN